MAKFCAPPVPPEHGKIQRWGKFNVSAAALSIANSIRQQARGGLIISPSVAEAELLQSQLALFLSQDELKSVALFPDWETLPYDSFSPHQDIISDRLRCLYTLHNDSRACVIVSAQTLLQRLCPLEYVSARSLVLKTGQTLESQSFLKQLVHAGYERVDTVFQHGEFALRGSLIDIFPMGSDHSYRIELFDDDVESLRSFDPETQRSIESVDKIELLPGRECPLDEQSIARFRDNWHNHFAVDHRECLIYQDVNAGLPPAGIEYYLPLFFEETSSLLDYLPKEALIYSFEGIEQSFENFWRELQNRYESRAGDLQRPVLKPAKIFHPVSDIYAQIKSHARIHIGADSQQTGFVEFEQQLLPNLSVDARLSNPLQRLQLFLNESKANVLFCAESEGRREALKEHLARIGKQAKEFSSIQAFFEKPSQLSITVAALEHGISSQADNYLLIGESMLFGEHVQQSRRRNKDKDDHENIVKNLTELKINAPVVHIEHGVGRYMGLETIEHGGQADEFLVLLYADQAKLYVPVGNLHLISRYSGSDELGAPLNKLGSDQWSRAKRKAAEKIRDVAAELLHVYAQREARKGFKHEVPEDPYQRFSAEFPFEETVDQSNAIAAVRKDMLAPKPMDRLVCGDVGFGKTEVAMRAAFIAVHNSKQVAVLVPTTLLAQQHYDNFKDRFANWPVNVEVLSRFKTNKETEEAKKRISGGKADIVIGTHKIIGQDIQYENLGLVIIDEEHRFGVRQKDALKSLRAEVDILTMTATPIPRTLNMSMSGIRDLSIIATPPAKRLSVKTFVRENDDNLVKEAISREIMRGGQVYYLHNEVSSIEKRAEEIRKLIPEARVQVGHGQMRERELEAVMSDFYHKRFNILVCTTIIETGIDVPSANTIILDRADKFGLAQLHQLRGRVGRSHHQAYAYLMIPNRKALTADAQKRLDAIEEAQDLGAGFTLASHDMEIRGAGELLGEEQSGQMQTIGFTLYMDMLDQAVKAIKEGKEVDLEAPFEHEVEINLRIPALIPEAYLPDVNLRLNLYKRLASAADEAALEDLQVEMIDRFGLLPPQIKNLMRQTRLRFMAESLGIAKIEASANGGRIEFAKETSVEPLAIVKLVQSQPQRYKLQGANQLQFSEDLEAADERLNFIFSLVQSLESA